MRILVIGKSGQVANALQRAADDWSSAIFTVGRPQADITNPDTLERAIDETSPNLIVNAAAYTAVDTAESDEEAAYAVNAHGPAYLSKSCANHRIPLIHLSTDYVYSGDKDGPYLETDTTAPTGIYGKSKLAGEYAVRETLDQHIILRTAWVFDRTGNNFPRTMLRLARDRDEISVVDDQRGNPTAADEIAAAILASADKLAVDPADCWGIFHFAGPQQLSWAELAKLVFECSSRHGGPTAVVKPIPGTQYPTPAKRPSNSMLDSEKFRETFSYRHADVKAVLDKCMPHWLKT